METNQRERLKKVSPTIAPLISVVMVLLIIGIASIVGIISHNLVDKIKSNSGYVAILEDSVTQAELDLLINDIRTLPSTKGIDYIPSDTVLQQWTRLTGNDIITEAGINPFSAEIDVTVQPQFALTDSLSKIAQTLSLNPSIADIELRAISSDNLLVTLNDIWWIILVVGIFLLLISITLISNTVKIALYTQRSLIYTMRLVGATDSYIVWPYFKTYFKTGLSSSIIAILILSIGYYYLVTYHPEISSLVTLTDGLIIASVLTAIGVSVTCITAWLSARCYVRIPHDKIYL